MVERFVSAPQAQERHSENTTFGAKRCLKGRAEPIKMIIL
jgi:hypothetical protein